MGSKETAGWRCRQVLPKARVLAYAVFMKLHRCAGDSPIPAMAAGTLAVLALLSGCATPPAPDSDSAFDAALRGGDVGAREAWIVRAASEPDSANERILLASLYSDDAGERMLAITALSNKYGDRLGYDYAAGYAARLAAAERWRAKLFPQQLPPKSGKEAAAGLSPRTLHANTSGSPVLAAGTGLRQWRLVCESFLSDI